VDLTVVEIVFAILGFIPHGNHCNENDRNNNQFSSGENHKVTRSPAKSHPNKTTIIGLIKT